MPRTNVVMAARREWPCVRCGEKIKVGEPYKWFKIKLSYGGIRKNYHIDCQIMPWERTNSPTQQHVLMAQHSNEEALASLGGDCGLEDCAQVVRDYAESVRELGQMKQESADNLESGFGHPTEQSEMLAEAAQNCESLADELDSVADDIEQMEDPNEEDTAIADELGLDLADEDSKDAIEEAREERRQAAIDAATDAVQQEPEV